MSESHFTLLRRKLIEAWEANSARPPNRIELEERSVQVVRSIHELQCSTGKPDTTTLQWFAFTGFGHKLLRDAVVAVIRYFLKPRMAYCAMTASSRWEGLLSLRAVDAERLQEVCSLFCAGISIIEIDTFMGDAMMACLHRIEHGHTFAGNYFTKKNSSFRKMYVSARRQMEEAQQLELATQVQHITGRMFTPRNMMELYSDYRRDVGFWRQTHNENIRQSREHLDYVNAQLSVLDARLRALLDEIHENNRAAAHRWLSSDFRPTLLPVDTLSVESMARLRAFAETLHELRSSRSLFLNH